MKTNRLQKRIEKMEKESGSELPPDMREMQRRGPQNEMEALILAIQRRHKGPGIAPLIQVFGKVGRESEDCRLQIESKGNKSEKNHGGTE